ncbi:MAG: hypothetical protein K2M22_01680 [Lachnospiraceae bacterium]|nr:hypothetical protein [Lachnospiraceae bacterium]MDE7178636.1 hypothetical protein [Lachnospiraceae bacterium]
MMVRWFRVLGDQYIGFWIIGLVLFALQEIPYMVMPLFKLENNPIMNMQESSAVLDVCEKVLGVSCIVMMTFIVHEKATFFRIGNGVCKIGFILAVFVLLLNFVGWGLYFSGHQTIGVMMFFIVILPPLYYVFVGLWRENWLLLTAGIIFEIVHFCHVYGNLKM